MAPFLLAVMGPTASGKTGLAERLADATGAQLINADAFQAYRGMDIGTAKPADKRRYVLLDIKDPNEGYGVGEFVQRSVDILARLHAEGRSAIVVGGTGLYIRALMEGYDQMSEAPDPALRENLNRRLREHGLDPLVQELRDRSPEAYARVDLRNPIRVIRALERLEAPPAKTLTLPPFQRVKVALLPDSSQLEAAIARRVHDMVQNGWVREVRALADAGFGPDDPGLRAIGYRQLMDTLSGRVELEEAIAATIAETRRYAKRQRTWLRSEPNLHLLEEPDPFRQTAELIHFV